jgi:hypothetical protein
MAYFKKGKEHWNWKGGVIRLFDGRILIYTPSHPFCNKDGYVRQSRLVIEKKIGRFLKPEEVVHHINGIRDDDRLENLKLFKSNGKHISGTEKGKRHKSKYEHFDSLPKFFEESKIVSIKRNIYICKKCKICNELFWTKKRSERPLAKTCNRKCLAILIKSFWDNGNYKNVKWRNQWT